jgi:signal transduction histidine kinase
VSLRLRLALWYGATAGALIVLVCVYSFALHSRTHYDDLDWMLGNMAAHVAEELAAAGSSTERAAVLRAAATLGPQVRVYSETDGAIGTSTDQPTPGVSPRRVLQSGNQPAYGFLASLVRLPHLHVEHPGVFTTLRAQGERWRVYVLPIVEDSDTLAVIAPIGGLDASVAAFGRVMLLMAVFGSGAAFLVGWMVAGRGIRPVAVLTETAGAIARSREFARRVPIGAARDELGRLAATFNEMLASLEQVYATQQRFIADASHELRAPLTLIQANLELLLRPRLDPEQQAAAAQEAHREASRLARLVADLLVLARADAGMPIRRERVELDRLAMEVLGEVRHLAAEHRLAVDGLEPSIVVGDPDRLRQLLLILLENAVKYTPPGGRIAMSLGRENGTAVVTVRDTGIGIDPDHLPRVFERFYRADAGRSRDPGGTGLGLSIAQWIVSQHDGSIELASRPGEGTEAVVRLPIST